MLQATRVVYQLAVVLPTFNPAWSAAVNSRRILPLVIDQESQTTTSLPYGEERYGVLERLLNSS